MMDVYPKKACRVPINPFTAGKNFHKRALRRHKWQYNCEMTISRYVLQSSYGGQIYVKVSSKSAVLTSPENFRAYGSERVIEPSLTNIFLPLCEKVLFLIFHDRV